ncbi:MAG: LLM class flavin-dependent oxidoreductase [Chloroflexi bacterium]|nr:LLM class flavin-dependent oxidoreductase [Chloroflexota bacterium]
MRIGVELAVKATVNELVEYLKLYDSHGFDRVWIPDSNISLWEMWTVATLAATHTKRVRIGVGVSSPYHRSPAVIAQAAATLDRLSGGRIDLTVGRGGREFLKSIGADGDDAGVEEAIGILRGLLKGGTVSAKGAVFKFDEVSLRVKAAQERVPIYIAAMSERWMESAARCADGVHVYTSNPKLLTKAKKWATASGRGDFAIITTLGYVEPEEVRVWWVTNFGKNYNLQQLCGREVGKASYEELAEELVFTDRFSLLNQVDRLERLGVDELMIAYRRPEDLPTIAELVRSI